MSELKTIIINVDDDPVNWERVEGILGNDYDVRSYASGQEALAAIRELKDKIAGGCEVIVMTDFEMPLMNGLEFLKALFDEKYNLPTAFVTATPVKNIKDMAAQMEVDVRYCAFQNKPFSKDGLKGAVKLAVTLHNLSKKEQSGPRTMQEFVARKPQAQSTPGNLGL